MNELAQEVTKGKIDQNQYEQVKYPLHFMHRYINYNDNVAYE